MAFLELQSELKKKNLIFSFCLSLKSIIWYNFYIILANILGRFENAIYKSTINQMKENDH